MSPIVIRFGRLGDMLLLAPLLRHLHHGYGEPCLLLGTGSWSAQLYAAHPDVAQVLEVNARHRPLAFSPQRWQMLRALRTHHDAPVHVCETEPRALAKIRRMLALAHMDPAYCVFLTDTPSQPEEHWIERLLRGCGHPAQACENAWHSPTPPNRVAPRLYLHDTDRHDRDTWLHARGWRGEPLWLVQPANKCSMRWNGPRDIADDDKAWPLANWVSLLRALHVRHADARILLCGVPHESPLLEAISRATGGAEIDVIARELPLRRLMALAEIAHGMVSVDTGPAHVAAAMSCPLLVLYGAQPSSLWLPRSPTGSAVVALGGLPQRNRVAQIPLHEVIAALETLPVGTTPHTAG